MPRHSFDSCEFEKELGLQCFAIDTEVCIAGVADLDRIDYSSVSKICHEINNYIISTYGDIPHLFINETLLALAISYCSFHNKLGALWSLDRSKKMEYITNLDGFGEIAACQFTFRLIPPSTT